MKKKFQRILNYGHLIKTMLHTQDTKHLQNMLEAFAPNESFIDYNKLLNLVKHQIKEYKTAQKQIEEHAEYWLYKSKQSRNDYLMLEDKIQEWEWFLELLEERYEILTF